MRFGTALAVAVFSVVSPTLAQSTGEIDAAIQNVLGDHTKYRTAFDALKAAVAEGDEEAVAALASYPLVVKTDGRVMIETPEDFAAGYDAIMTEEIVAAIEAQSYENVIVNEQGIGFGNGQVWLAGVCEDDDCVVWDVKIITIQSTADPQ